MYMTCGTHVHMHRFLCIYLCVFVLQSVLLKMVTFIFGVYSFIPSVSHLFNLNAFLASVKPGLYDMLCFSYSSEQRRHCGSDIVHLQFVTQIQYILHPGSY